MPSPAEQVKSSAPSIPADHPIQLPDEDLLCRKELAREFADQVCCMDASEGVVVGVLGPWGSGKTSFINLSRPRFNERGIEVIEFNPWMFSGTEQLVGAFFKDVSAQIKLKPGLADTGKVLEEYGRALSELGQLPVVGPWIALVHFGSWVAARILRRKDEGIVGIRMRIRNALAKRSTPIVVVLDDIDRLTTAEIRHIFRLIRLTANFPNLIYVLAFDRSKVERALTEDNLPGRDYLEKIIQLSFDLPAIPRHLLDAQVFAELDKVLERLGPDSFFDQDRWWDVFVEVIQPLIRNLRDVRRYAAALNGTAMALNGKVALVDLFGLEAVRVFLPDVFHLMTRSVKGLTTPADPALGGPEAAEKLKKQVLDLVEAAASHNEVAKDLIERLFPAASRHLGGAHHGVESSHRWLREHRPAHEDILRLYLERVVGTELQSFNDAERAWLVLGDEVKLGSFLDSVEPSNRQGVISGLEAFQGQFTPEHIRPAVSVLLNALATLPDLKRGFSNVDARRAVIRVVLRILGTETDPEKLTVAVREILPEIDSLNGQGQLILLVGHVKDAGRKLIPESEATALEGEWRERVRASLGNAGSLEKLIRERDLFRTLRWARKPGGPSDPPLFEIPDDPILTLAILESAKGESIQQPFGSRAQTHTPHLAWPSLIDLFGSEETLRERLLYLLADPPAGLDEELASLTRMYLEGRKPDSFFGD